MNKNILITGVPGCGKTTLFRRLVQELMGFQPVGFYTKEIRESVVRKGFELTSFDGMNGLLAHVDLSSNFKVGRYAVDVAGFENFIGRIPFSGHTTKLVMIDVLPQYLIFLDVVCQSKKNCLLKKFECHNLCGKA
jgi:nucleoside-triphosphatase THEP1